MNIVLGSAHRSNSSRLSRYFDQISDLRSALPEDSFRVVAVEGDSTDNTRAQLDLLSRRHHLDLTLIDCSHGGPDYGSTESPQRMKALSKVGNAILDGVKDSDDILIYIESDLVWEPEAIKSLISLAKLPARSFDIFSPMIMCGDKGDIFYDIYAYRKDGQRFSPFVPYHSELSDDITEVDSVGSCLVMRADVARDDRVRMESGALVEWCDRAREAGYKIGVYPQSKVCHP